MAGLSGSKTAKSGLVVGDGEVIVKLCWLKGERERKQKWSVDETEVKS